ncbi:class I SAM-dependent methyltransferase [Roseobacter ponti]|nr:class I SAM-dependent methyltransferase [Roseobacter ponti]
MKDRSAHLDRRYAAAAPTWSDKMRLLGYLDAYLGFLSHMPPARHRPARVIDIGAGTGAMAEAWTAINGVPEEIVLLDPSRPMLEVAEAALKRRGVAPGLRVAALGSGAREQYDVLLAAHVIEHFDDPGVALRDIRRLAAPGSRLWLVVSKPHWCNVIVWLQWRHRTFRTDEVTGLLRDAGFDVESLYTFPSGPPSRTSFAVLARAA